MKMLVRTDNMNSGTIYGRMSDEGLKLEDAMSVLWNVSSTLNTIDVDHDDEYGDNRSSTVDGVEYDGEYGYEGTIIHEIIDMLHYKQYKVISEHCDLMRRQMDFDTEKEENMDDGEFYHG